MKIKLKCYEKCRHRSLVNDCGHKKPHMDGNNKAWDCFSFEEKKTEIKTGSWWPVFLERLEADNKHSIVSHLTNNIYQVSFYNDVLHDHLTLKTTNTTTYNNLKRPQQIKYLEGKIRDILGERIKVTIIHVLSHNKDAI